MTSRRASQTAWVRSWAGHWRALALLIVVADQMGQDFGVRGGTEGVAGFEELFLEAVVILDDAVVDDGDFAGLVQVRVGIFVGGRAVGGPAGVADAELAGGGLVLEADGPGPRQSCRLFCDEPGRPSESTARPALS